MKSLFRCPLCAAPLTREAHSALCPAGHCFDQAAAGYFDLLPVQQRHSKQPGDDKAMVAARNTFLEHGYYAPLRDALCGLAVSALPPETAEPVLLDSGCGEGYYTAGLFRAMEQAGRHPKAVGVDLSKFALRRAAKRLPQGEFAVASVYRLPLPDGSVDLLTNVFSPLAAEEFARVLRPGGAFLYVVPAPEHLWEMKQVLYEKPYENPVKREDYPGFTWVDKREVRYSVDLTDKADRMALFGMTPYAWKTPKAGIARLEALDRLTVQIGFDLHLYRKT